MSAFAVQGEEAQGERGRSGVQRSDALVELAGGAVRGAGEVGVEAPLTFTRQAQITLGGIRAVLARDAVVAIDTARLLTGLAHIGRDRLASVELLPLPERFIHHNSATLFGDESSGLVLPELGENTETLSLGDGLEAAGLRVLPWGTWNWPLTVSTPERAVLELLSELPARESFHHVDVLMEAHA